MANVDLKSLTIQGLDDTYVISQNLNKMAGTLDVDKGGTGVNSIEDLKEVLGVDLIDIANGGTGATTAPQARENLGLGNLATCSFEEFIASQTSTRLFKDNNGFPIYTIPGCTDITSDNDVASFNLNDLNYTGFYVWRGNAPTNAPFNWGFLINIRWGNYGVQIAISYAADSIKYRRNDGDGWKTWKTVTLS